ncbi:MAG: cobalt-precorrin-5B (C(1))-methyltransferase [Gammaproteobacteria bacterium]|nr:cobalt-precorrin-5B (C(1))-methyltransferase [Gammaproteobacteria bacterium]
MWPESAETPPKLRSGLTTGCCATACCVAAAELLLAKQTPQRVFVSLPRGQEVSLELDQLYAEGDFVHAATIKDAGDDPDVTHGARVFVRLSLLPEGIHFAAGEGVGMVTRSGLLLAVGEPAINPVPRKMMTEHLQRLAQQHHYDGGFQVTVGVENGQALALKTMNPRLGILGGLSILGTTGIVRPYSCSAYIASIRQGIDVARSNGQSHLAASTGSSSEAFIRDRYQLPEMALIEMGDFVGALLKHLKKNSVQKISICGGFGKLTKLACGHLDLHSTRSQIDFVQLAKWAQELGAEGELVEKIRSANTSAEVLRWCQATGIDLGLKVCQEAHGVARRQLLVETALEIWAVDRLGGFVGCFEK